MSLFSVKMTGAKQKSRTFRRLFRTTPGGRRIIQYKKRAPSKVACYVCGDNLKGVARLSPIRLKNTPKSARRPQRPFGGVLCSKCARKEIKKRART